MNFDLKERKEPEEQEELTKFTCFFVILVWISAVSPVASALTHALTSLMCIVLVAYFYYNTRTLSRTISQAEFNEKMRLVDSVLAGRVFETNINELPILSKLFKEYEKAQKYFIPGLNMTDYDGGCDHLYEDIVSGDFDKEYYADKEYQYKVSENRMDERERQYSFLSFYD